MAKAFGIVNFAGNHIRVEGMQEYRPVGAFSFLGRYRVIDFPISNMSNSGIDHIQVYIRRNPQSLTAHLGTGRHYNINSKSGNLQILYSGLGMNMSLYNNDIASYIENLEYIEQELAEYVVIAPSYMVYTQDYKKLLNDHIESGADITMLYHTVDNAKRAFINCNVLNLNKQKGVLDIGGDNAVRSFREKKASDGAMINAGYMVLNPEKFDYLDGDNCVFEKAPLQKLAEQGQLMSYIHKGFWQCMDNKREMDLLEKMFTTGNAPWKKWED